MKVLDLFSGIGGFSLGLERAGFQTVAFCEIESYCQAVLRKHWPDVPVYDDVRTLSVGRLAADGIFPDVICGGFPCQDISVAGTRVGIEGERSGLWHEYARLIGELRPRFAIVENVSALLSRGMDVVLGSLASLGYDAEWHCIPATAVGAPHRRDRIWIVAYPNGRRAAQSPGRQRKGGLGSVVGGEALADVPRNRRQPRRPRDTPEGARGRQPGGGGVGAHVPDSHRRRGEAVGQREEEGRATHAACGARLSFAAEPDRGGWWLAEPDVGRVAHGIPARVDRLRALGNAVVPILPEIIGRAILNSLHA